MKGKTMRSFISIAAFALVLALGTCPSGQAEEPLPPSVIALDADILHAELLMKEKKLLQELIPLLWRQGRYESAAQYQRRLDSVQRELDLKVPLLRRRLDALMRVLPPEQRNLIDP